MNTETERMFPEQAGDRACYCDVVVGCHIHPARLAESVAVLAKVRLEWALRSIWHLHHESPTWKGFCNECSQPHPCITRQEATDGLAHIDGEETP